MDKCEHSKLYITDFANQPSPLGRCLFCEVDALQSKLTECEQKLAAANKAGNEILFAIDDSVEDLYRKFTEPETDEGSADD